MPGECEACGSVAPALPDAVEQCRRDGAFMADVERLYARVDAEVAAAGATCLGGGTCCRFDLWGHRVFASTGELALLSGQVPPGGVCRRPMWCAYQVGPRCTARPGRPLGCRVFFCHAELDDWSGRLYEKYHRLLRDLHRRHRAPYAYVELTGALTAIFARRRELR